MFGRKTKAKGKRRSSWRWLTALLMGLAAVFIAAWRVMVKRTSRERGQTQPVASKPAAEKGKQTQSTPPKPTGEEEKESPIASETTSSEVDTAPPSE